MGIIKSSWEVAMERTADIKGDKESVHANEMKKTGKRLASEYIYSDKPDIKEFEKKLGNYSGEDKKLVQRGAFEVFLSYISLPQDEQYGTSLELAQKGLELLTGNKKAVASIMEQVHQFFGQFLQHQDQLKQQLKQQYEPQLKRKQQELSRQYGSEIELQPEQDPEFNQALRKNMQQLESQYQQALNEVKEQLTSYFYG
jgi:hypothetical protein